MLIPSPWCNSPKASPNLPANPEWSQTKSSFYPGAKPGENTGKREEKEENRRKNLGTLPSPVANFLRISPAPSPAVEKAAAAPDSPRAPTVAPSAAVKGPTGAPFEMANSEATKMT